MKNGIASTRLIRIALSAWGIGREPMSLVHFVTRRCDARCEHCFIDFDAPVTESDNLSITEIETIAKHIGDLLVNVNITGGEPFLVRDLWSICEAWFRCARTDSVYITTHGGFPQRIQSLAEKFLASDLGGRLFVSVSIDNFPEAHDQHRRVPGLFARAIDSVDRLSAFENDRLGVGVSITVAEHNYEQVLNLYRHLREELGISVITATLRRAAGVAAPLEKELAQRVGEAYSALTKEIVADFAEAKRGAARRGFVARMQDAKDKLLYEILRENVTNGSRYRMPCHAGSLFAVMQPNGNIEGCEVRGDAHLGNIRDFHLAMDAVLDSPMAASWRRSIRAERCHCSYECALGVNIVASPRNVPRLAFDLF